MTIARAQEIAGTLGNPSKMPGKSYGLPAVNCKVGGLLAKIGGTVCSGCYALKGNYRFKSVQASQAKRLAGITHPEWVDAMTLMIEQSGETFFRWHDSGDIQSSEHLERIFEVARRLPGVQFWLPTKEYGLVKSPAQQCPPNLVIRVSGARVDGPAPTWAENSSTVVSSLDGEQDACPAPTQGNKCGDCRNCWDKGVKNVAYHVH